MGCVHSEIIFVRTIICAFGPTWMCEITVENEMGVKSSESRSFRGLSLRYSKRSISKLRKFSNSSVDAFQGRFTYDLISCLVSKISMAGRKTSFCHPPPIRTPQPLPCHSLLNLLTDHVPLQALPSQAIPACVRFPKGTCIACSLPQKILHLPFARGTADGLNIIPSFRR